MHEAVIVVLVTAPAHAIAVQIAQHLLENRLAACVNILPAVNSLYIWRGAPQQDNEVLLLIKTRLDLFQDRLVPAIKALHPYELPEIIALPVVAGSPDYLNWVLDETSSPQ